MIDNGNCQNKTDNELVKLSFQNTDYFGCLVQRYEGKLGRYIYRISGGSKEDIEDLLQEIFLAIYRNLNDFDSALKFSSWIYRIAHNKVISHYRKVKARAQLIGGEESERLVAMIKDDNDIHEKVNDKITGEVLSELFKKIDIKYKEVLVLKYFEQKDYNEISDILKKPVGTVGTLLSRAKQQLRQIITQESIKL
jgi:RNA polymerase sigma-70 factor (ECF subfamily)